MNSRAIWRGHLYLFTFLFYRRDSDFQIQLQPMYTQPMYTLPLSCTSLSCTQVQGLGPQRDSLVFWSWLEVFGFFSSLTAITIQDLLMTHYTLKLPTDKDYFLAGFTNFFYTCKCLSISNCYTCFACGFESFVLPTFNCFILLVTRYLEDLWKEKWKHAQLLREAEMMALVGTHERVFRGALEFLTKRFACPLHW